MDRRKRSPTDLALFIGGSHPSSVQAPIFSHNAMKSPTTPKKSISPENGPDLTDEIAAEEEDDELEISDEEKEQPFRDPELTDSELDSLTTWDEPNDLSGHRIAPTGLEDDDVAGQLVEEGLDLAEDELRDQEELDEALEEDEEEEADARSDRA